MHTLALLPPVEGLAFNEAEHRYTVNHPNFGCLTVPSTTQVMAATECKPTNFSAWRQSLLRNGSCSTEAEADALMEEHRSARAGIGTDFHHLAECTLLGGDPRSTTNEAIEMIWQWVGSFLPRIGKVLLVEQPMLHRAFMYCGTPDLLAEIDGELTLCDWKTQQAGKEKIRPEWALQVGAYAKLIEHTYDITLRKAAMVVITTDGVRIQPYNYADIQQGAARFFGFLSEFHALQAKLGSLPSQVALTAMQPLFA